MVMGPSINSEASTLSLVVVLVIFFVAVKLMRFLALSFILHKETILTLAAVVLMWSIIFLRLKTLLSNPI